MTTFVPPVDQTAPGLETRAPDGAFASQRTLFLGVAAVGLIASAVGWMTDSKQFYFSYLVAYVFVMGLCLGSMGFVLIQHLTRAGWSVVVRRVAENMMGASWILIPLFIPIAIGFDTLYHHWVHPDPSDTVLAGKAGFLNPTFWFIRVGIYFVIWLGISTWFRKKSIEQDQTGDPAISLKMTRVAAPCMVLFALSLTFASIDWLMTLDPHWFSTMFGVYIFAGAFLSTMAILPLILMSMQRKGLLAKAVTTEHYHDLGKLLFAFVVFWAYVSFSQFMLIYFANLPEETLFYRHRYVGAWGDVGLLLCLAHFAIPFMFLMSRHLKRGRATLQIAAVLMLVMHWIDMHWLVMPTHHAETMHLSWIDFVTVIGTVGLLMTVFYRNMASAPLLPERDPRLAESLKFNNA